MSNDNKQMVEKIKKPRERKRVQKKFNGWNPDEESKTYDSEFYLKHRKYYERGISNLVVWLKENFEFSSIVDVGCGVGDFLLPLAEDKKILGIDFSTGARDMLVIDKSKFIHHDLTTPFQSDLGKWDLVMSLETYEHIPEQFENVFLDNLCHLKPKHLILSCAEPGQIGRHHYNCRGALEVVPIIEKRGFIVNNELTTSFQKLKKLASFYKKNTVIFDAT